MLHRTSFEKTELRIHKHHVTAIQTVAQAQCTGEVKFAEQQSNARSTAAHFNGFNLAPCDPPGAIAVFAYRVHHNTFRIRRAIPKRNSDNPMPPSITAVVIFVSII